MKILITGGAGFLGRHLARRYATRGHAVTVLDDLSSPNSRFDVPELVHPLIRRLEGSTLDGAVVAEALRSHETVVHFASLVGVAQTIEAPIDTARNLTGTLNLVDRLTPEHTILFGSSADVYGMHSEIHRRPMREDDDVLFEHAGINRWVYPKIKSIEENVIAASPAKSVTVRIFNCIGPGMDTPYPKRVVPRFLKAVAERQPLRLSGSGDQIRCFSYYTDTLDGVELALRYASERPGGPAGAFNIGNDQAISIAELARLVNRIAVEMGLLDEPLPIVGSSRDLYSQAFNDGWGRIPDLERSRALLGYRPSIPLESALRRTLAAMGGGEREWAKAAHA